MQMIRLYNLARIQEARKRLSNNHSLKFNFLDSCFVQYVNIFKKKKKKIQISKNIYIYWQIVLR